MPFYTSKFFKFSVSLLGVGAISGGIIWMMGTINIWHGEKQKELEGASRSSSNTVKMPKKKLVDLWESDEELTEEELSEYHSKKYKPTPKIPK
ncbi:hypothetical protein MHLP_02210 [Candidatus Mycoplasma haematolamae str. Purdue]|uniref:Uncharacterized protein n=1 Tax=Mycoplasma haematolamae (strain Purdue) TaxID=1212765 RepID=I7C6A1_MYCHA|nr:hypothetical protein [Candidatus Mycoplasma haematolamae]AFO52022.1 hypothetical protein MHLP_02210 [Candidatus Mycoplasma haematolamae str. Purdue]